MLLDVGELGGLAEGGDIPVEVAEPLVERWVSATDVADVALEVLDVDGVEADDGLR
jgi:hypothetical protein